MTLHAKFTVARFHKEIAGGGGPWSLWEDGQHEIAEYGVLTCHEGGA